jgi:general secretion pathway protein F
MPFVVTPGQLRSRADLYHQLGQLTAAGIGIIEALQLQLRNPPLPSFRAPLAAILERLKAGANFGEALYAAGSWLTAFDRALLDAGDRSGRLPATFQQLAAHYTSTAAILRQTISSFLYPAFLFHFAIFIFPLPDLVLTGNILLYFAKTFAILLPLYAVIFLLIHSMRGTHSEAWRGRMEQLLHRVPLAGAARRSMALARLTSALEALISAGVTIIEAWQLAADASGSPALRSAIASWQPRLAAGVTPAGALEGTPEFPVLFANLYSTGEITGTLDDTLRRLHALYLDEGTRKLKALADWLPKIVYLLVALMIAIKVIGFWSGYFKQIGDAMNF